MTIYRFTVRQITTGLSSRCLSGVLHQIADIDSYAYGDLDLALFVEDGGQLLEVDRSENPGIMNRHSR